MATFQESGRRTPPDTIAPVVLVHLRETPHLARLVGVPGAQINLASPEPLALPDGDVLTEARVFGRTYRTNSSSDPLPYPTSSHWRTGRYRDTLNTSNFFAYDLTAGAETGEMPFRLVAQTKVLEYRPQRHHLRREGVIEGVQFDDDSVTIGRPVMRTNSEGNLVAGTFPINEALVVFTDRPATDEEITDLPPYRAYNADTAQLMTGDVPPLSRHIDEVTRRASMGGTLYALGVRRTNA